MYYQILTIEISNTPPLPSKLKEENMDDQNKQDKFCLSR